MFTIKQNDTLPVLEAQFFDSIGNPLDLDLCGVRFHMSEYGAGKILIDKPVDIVDSVNGKVRYQWDIGDTSRFGMFNGEFEVNMPDGKVLTVPNDTYFTITIIKELA